jgi:hypothetical protein
VRCKTYIRQELSRHFLKIHCNKAKIPANRPTKRPISIVQIVQINHDTYSRWYHRSQLHYRRDICQSRRWVGSKVTSSASFTRLPIANIISAHFLTSSTHHTTRLLPSATRASSLRRSQSNAMVFLHPQKHMVIQKTLQKIPTLTSSSAVSESTGIIS